MFGPEKGMLDNTGRPLLPLLTNSHSRSQGLLLPVCFNAFQPKPFSKIVERSYEYGELMERGGICFFIAGRSIQKLS